LLFGNVVGAGAHVLFPRAVRGMPILFPGRYRYAEDYGLWCTLSQMGRVSCPPEIVYRYRQHAASITSRQRLEQQQCLSQIRQAYQSRYIPHDVSVDTADEVSRFWRQDGSRPLGAETREIESTLCELRSRFLAYVQTRFGPQDRAALDADLDEAFRERLGYWIYRSLRFGDATASGALLSAAAARGEAVNVTAKAGARLAHALRRKCRRLFQS
jgi:hypothetical protein